MRNVFALLLLSACSSPASALTLSRRHALRSAGAALGTAAALLPAVAGAKVTPEQRAQIYGLYGERVPEDMSDAEFRQRYAAGSAFSQERQDMASSLEAKMGISSVQVGASTKISASEQRDIARKAEKSTLKVPKEKPVPRNRQKKADE